MITGRFLNSLAAMVGYLVEKFDLTNEGFNMADKLSEVVARFRTSS